MLKAPISAVILTGTLMTGAWPAAHADEVVVSKSDRQAIIASLREHPAFAHLKDMKLDVRRIWMSPRYAYLCGLPIGVDRRYAQTDGMFDVVQVAFRREGAHWQVAARVDGLSETLKHVQCMAPADGKITEAFVEGLTKDPGLHP